MPRHLAIFDMDGTLVDLHGAVDFDALLVEALSVAGGSVPGKAARLAFWSEGKGHAAWLRHQGVHDAPAFWDVFDALDNAARHRAIQDGFVTPILGVHDALGRLKAAGTVLAVLTNTPVGLARVELDACGLLDGYFDHVVGLGGEIDQSRAKPEPAGIQHIMSLTGIPATCTVMIGDSMIDMLAAARAGVAGVLVLAGVLPSGSVPGTSAVVTSVAAVTPALLAGLCPAC